MDGHNFVIHTFTGKLVDPWNLTTADIHIEDIAHALSHLCRFTGHTRDFYSVAQHCLLVSQMVPAHLALVGLLHDAGEAYFNDLSKAVKHFPDGGMEGYRRGEHRAQDLIYWRFGVHQGHDPNIKRVDNEVCELEKRVLFPPYAEFFTAFAPRQAEATFLNRFNELFKQKHQG